MSETLGLIIQDVSEILQEISISSLAKPAFFGLWLIILFMPLRAVDRRDALACLVYTLFITAAAVTLLYALPQTILYEESSLHDEFITIMILSALAIIRWNWNYQDLTEFKTKFLDNEKAEEGNAKGEAQ